MERVNPSQSVPWPKGQSAPQNLRLGIVPDFTESYEAPLVWDYARNKEVRGKPVHLVRKEPWARIYLMGDDIGVMDFGRALIQKWTPIVVLGVDLGLVGPRLSVRLEWEPHPFSIEPVSSGADVESYRKPSRTPTKYVDLHARGSILKSRFLASIERDRETIKQEVERWLRAIKGKMKR